MSKVNTFLYSNLSNSKLSDNKPHQFAMMYALVLYRQAAVYTFIPKNGCSTMRLSLALNNGTIKTETNIDWIHKNNSTFGATLSEAASCKYSFVILRCPFRRLVSVFLDKFVNKDPLVERYKKVINSDFDVDNLTFRYFVESLRENRVVKSNIHWRPQVDFLLYDDYSDYFQLENFGHASSVLLDKIDFSVKDARGLTKHGVDGYDKDYQIESAFDLPVSELLLMKSQGTTPEPVCFFNEGLKMMVKNIYCADFDIYQSKFGDGDLLF